MTTLLHIDAAAHQSTESVTRSLSSRYVDAWLQAHPGENCIRRDLATDPAPALDSAYCALGRRLEQDAAYDGTDVDRYVTNETELATWRQTAPLIEELLQADEVLIATPMYNFGIPAALKAWIDRITFPRVLDPVGRPEPLQFKRFVLLTATGGCYGPGTPRADLNFLLPHLRGWLTAYGARPERIEEVIVEASLAPLVDRLAPLRAQAAQSLRNAEARLLAVASSTPPTAVDASPRSDQERKIIVGSESRPGHLV